MAFITVHINIINDLLVVGLESYVNNVDLHKKLSKKLKLKITGLLHLEFLTSNVNSHDVRSDMFAGIIGSNHVWIASPTIPYFNLNYPKL